ncbi:MAG: ribonuclease HI [Christensenellaceae bacterium]|nr:ribonuclease HI [Christensenellaceae bacterium]
MKKVDVYTDGACSGNPGPGGWGAILVYNGQEKELSGFQAETTNNRMELFAAIQGLSALKESCEVKLYSDSSYLVNAFEQRWIDSWQRQNWKTSAKAEVANQDLWRLLLIQTGRHRLQFIKVKGHADNEYNNRCDKLATGAIKQQQKLRARVE